MTTTEDKLAYCRMGESLEYYFLERFVPRLCLDMVRNPRKVVDPYSPDLLWDGQYADLKVQRTPFFTAQRYGYDPAFTVTFNRKDLERYQRLYPEIRILFYVVWIESSFRGISVPRVHGLWWTDLLQLHTLAQHEHQYQRRRNDQYGNARSSFLIDVRTCRQLW